MDDSFRPSKTQDALDPKAKEWHQFCEYAYADDPYKYIITPEKVYRFFFYQAFRSKRNIATEADPDNPNAKKKRKKRDKGVYFDPKEYDEIMMMYSGKKDQFPIPEHPMSFQSFDQYKAAVKNIHALQLERKVNGLGWEMIWTATCKKLHRHVKDRAPLLKKLNYAEKVDSEFAAYTIVERYEEIEKEFWDDSVKCTSRRSILTTLRHKACFQYLAAGILRSESLHRAEISDFVLVRPPKLETDVHQASLMVTQLPFGKTNKNRKLYGRATRHKNVNLCAVSAVALYLQFRFWCTGELKEMTPEDWTDPKIWFDIKFLIDLNSNDTTKEMSNDSYGKHMKKVLKKLCIVCNKLLHLGRHVGARLLELLEEESEEIRRMGQWNPSMQDNHYSAKLPMGPIRKLAGYNSQVKMYFNTRTTVMPGRDLLEQCPIGQWSYKAFEGIMDLEGEYPTALAVLNFLNEMNVVMLQDAAVLQLTGRHHPMFDMIPVFRSEAYQVSMEEHLFATL